MPAQRMHTRLPSPIHMPHPIMSRNRTYGNPDKLNDDNDESLPSSPPPESTTNVRTAGDGSDKKSQRSVSNPSLRNNSAPIIPPDDSRIIQSNSLDNDSGNLSLEASSSPPSNETPTTATPLKTALDQEQIEDEQESPLPTKTPESPEIELPQILKDNPFKVSNIAKNAPNKIILEPITHPIRDKLDAPDDINGSNVPRHLFTVKKSSQ